jgi:hypothetical protein
MKRGEEFLKSLLIPSVVVVPTSKVPDGSIGYSLFGSFWRWRSGAERTRFSDCHTIQV